MNITRFRLSEPPLASGGEALVYPFGPDKVVKIWEEAPTGKCLVKDNKISSYLGQIPWFIGYYGLGYFEVNDEIKVGAILERGDTTFYTEITQGDLNYLDKVSILSCILLGLNIARDRYALAHRDLHLGNIVLKLNPEYPKSVQIENFIVKEFKYSPRIIDFGVSSITLEGTRITACDWERGNEGDLISTDNLIWNDVEVLLSELMDAEGDEKTEFSMSLKELQKFGENIGLILSFISSKYPYILSKKY